MVSRPTGASVLEAARAFGPEGGLDEVTPIVGGHINASFRCTYWAGPSLVLQRVNRSVFEHPELVMDNLVRILGHLGWERRFGRGTDSLRALTLVPTRAGRAYWHGADGSIWRAFEELVGTMGADQLDDIDLLGRAAREIGSFVATIDGLRDPPLAVTIPAFHDLAARVAELHRLTGAEALPEAGVVERLHTRFRAVAPPDVEAGPVRPVHNDAKLANLLVDKATGRPVALIDLDTTMPGLAVHDVGELVRSGSAIGRQEDLDPDLVRFEPVRAAALISGFAAGAAPVLTARELTALPFGGPMLALENAVRFLIDHLEGDRYFLVDRPDQNLDRARAHLELTQQMLDRHDEVVALLASTPELSDV